MDSLSLFIDVFLGSTADPFWCTKRKFRVQWRFIFRLISCAILLVCWGSRKKGISGRATKNFFFVFSWSVHNHHTHTGCFKTLETEFSSRMELAKSFVRICTNKKKGNILIPVPNSHPKDGLDLTRKCCRRMMTKVGDDRAQIQLWSLGSHKSKENMFPRFALVTFAPHHGAATRKLYNNKLLSYCMGKKSCPLW